MSVKLRQELERRIANAAIKQLLEAGYWVSVDNGEDETKPLRDAKLVDAALMQTDDDHLYVRINPKSEKADGWIHLVYGNDGYDVISEYTTNLEANLTEANKIADHYQVEKIIADDSFAD